MSSLRWNRLMLSRPRKSTACCPLWGGHMQYGNSTLLSKTMRLVRRPQTQDALFALERLLNLLGDMSARLSLGIVQLFPHPESAAHGQLQCTILEGCLKACYACCAGVVAPIASFSGTNRALASHDTVWLRCRFAYCMLRLLLRFCRCRWPCSACTICLLVCVRAGLASVAVP